MGNCVYLVTGAAGFIGFHLARELLGKGETVIGLDNINDYYDVRLKELRLAILKKYGNFDFIREDISHRQAIRDIFAEKKPDIVVNLAAQAGVRYSLEKPEAYIESNISGFFSILEACRNSSVKHLVYASSSSVYGSRSKVPFSVEDTADRPVSLYAATKKSNELMAYAYSHLFGIPATGLRFFTVYGPYGRPDMAYFKFADGIISGRPIQIYNCGDMERDFTYIDDAVEGIMCVIGKIPEADENGVRHKLYNIGNSRPENLTHFIEILEKALGRQAAKEFLPMQPGDVTKTFADIGGMKEDFGFTPKTSLEEGLGKFANWYLEYLSGNGRPL